VCAISNSAFVRCLSIVVGQLDRYNGEGTVAHRQRLVWKLSNRTLRHLRPTDKLRPTLPTIKETAKANAEANGHRMRWVKFIFCRLFFFLTFFLTFS
jgi:hypothetical protein